jgi:Domain of unknown function (DUF5069)
MTERRANAHPAAKDLSREEPRPMDAKLAGYPWLPRMIDKARADQADTLGEYYRYPCPIDAACQDLLGLDANTFREIANRARDDEEVIHLLAAIGVDAARLAQFDPVQLNADFHRSDS